MSQFYVSENNQRQADFYKAVLAMPAKERRDISKNASASAERYLMGGSSHSQYQKDRSTEWTYKRTDAELKKMIAGFEEKAEQALHDELERCRQWLFASFKLNKENRDRPDSPQKEHNLMCARSWVKTRWPEYKNARKKVKGF